MIKWIQENELNYRTKKIYIYINSVEENGKYKILEFKSQE